MNKPPSRLCANTDSEYFDPLWVKMPLVITVDGVKVHRCIEYSIDEGWARYAKVDEEGRPVISGDHWTEEVLEGEVRVTVEHEGFLT